MMLGCLQPWTITGNKVGKPIIQTPRSEADEPSGEHALPLCTLHYYTEVMDSKGLVLMRGEVNHNRLPLENAQFMAHQVQIFYLDNDVSMMPCCSADSFAFFFAEAHRSWFSCTEIRSVGKDLQLST